MAIGTWVGSRVAIPHAVGSTITVGGLAVLSLIPHMNYS
jgi:mannitol/fructose-specific phosphotransferase system IIA component